MYDDYEVSLTAVCGALLIYISTDNLLGGRNPMCGGAASVRAICGGRVSDGECSDFTVGKGRGIRELHHCQQRFPTDAREVATVCRKLAERARQDPSINGIFHFSGKEQMTKYEMEDAIVQAFNLPSNNPIPLTEQPVAAAPRPVSAQLSRSRLELQNLSVEPRPFTVAITDFLWPFTPDKRWGKTFFH
ncbi:hypothetical protein Q8A73_002718 [Channa argus]|nr:hypothetical protein Q8A73_002718 [Channa argus]